MTTVGRTHVYKHMDVQPLLLNTHKQPIYREHCMNYMGQQITDLLLRVCFVVLGFNVIFMLALPEKQCYNGVSMNTPL